MDRVPPEVRSRIMSKIRGRNTKPELALRRALYAEGVRFRIHNRSIPGTPDIAHKGARVAVFVDGCFWHGCPRHYRVPKSRVQYWAKRLAYNHDLRVRVKARLEGWTVLEVWECEIREDLAGVVGHIGSAIKLGRVKIAA